jgi:hypothetical protein
VLLADLVLRDECPVLNLIASPNANAKARHAFIEHNVFRLPVRQRNPVLSGQREQIHLGHYWIVLLI